MQYKHVVQPIDENVKPDFNQVGRYMEDLRKANPLVYRLFFGKNYRGVEDWYDYRIPAFTFAAAIVVAAQNIGPMAEKQFLLSQKNTDALTLHHAITASLLADKSNPTFFVSRELLEAVIHSNLPDEVDWKTLRMPFEAATFMFPKNALRLESKTVPYLTYARKPKIIKLYGTSEEANYSDANFTVHAMAQENAATYDFSIHKPFNAEALKIQTDRAAPAFQAGMLASFGAKDSHQLLMQIVFNLLFVMTARPELVEPGRQLKIERYKKRELREIWSPNFVGRRYRIQAEPGDGTHASPRMHWRRGHYRLQPYGKVVARLCECGCDRTRHNFKSDTDAYCRDCDCRKYRRHRRVFQFVKTLWIEPMLVNPPKTDEENLENCKKVSS